MNTKEFDYIGTFRKLLKKHKAYVSEKPCDGDFFFETSQICIGRLMTSFTIFIGRTGFMQIRYYPSGAIPSECSARLKETILKAAPIVQCLKVFTDKDDFITVTYDTILPADEKLIENELDDALGLINYAYSKMLPAVMLEYWQGVKRFAENL